MSISKARSADFSDVNFFSGGSFTRLTGFQCFSETNTGVLNLLQGYEKVQLNPKQFTSVAMSSTGAQSNTKMTGNFTSALYAAAEFPFVA